MLRLVMEIRDLFDSKLICGFLFCFILISWLPGCILAHEVTLDSIQIFTTHEWFPSKLSVYFQCKGENKTVMPDVKDTNVFYSFKGQESWQPLTELIGTKCKRCGFYEHDPIKSDDVFDEWEFCPSDFTANGKYTHFKEKEVNVTFLCRECSQVSSDSNADTGSQKERKGLRIAILILIIATVSTLVVLVVVVGYKHWLKRKRQQEQARFMKLFEDGDEIEDELGLEPTL